MKFFDTVRQKIFDGKSWYSLPPLIHKLFRYRTFSETQIRRVPLRNFSALWDKKLLTKNRDTPPSPLIHKFFRYQKICETPKGSPTKIFGTVREQIFYRKSWYSPHRHKVFRYPKLMKHWRVPLQKFSALWGKKFSTEDLDTPTPHPTHPPPHPLIHKLFRYQKFSETQIRRVPLRNFSALWDKKTFDKESWYSPSPLIHKIFRHQKLCETKKGSPTKFFGTVREQIFYRKSWSSPHRHKRFRYQKFSETQTGPRRNFSALWDKKNSTKNRDITLWSIKSFDTRN